MWTKGFLLHGNYIWKTLCILLMFSTGFTLFSIHFFFLYWSPFCLYAQIFDVISTEINEVLSINQSTNVFVFGDFNIYHKDKLTCTGGTDGTDGPGELCYNFSMSNDLTVTLTVLLFWIYSFLLSLLWKLMLLSHFPLTFCQTEKWIPSIIA